MDDDEEYEPIRPRPSDPPPLKRLWVAPPDPESAGEPAPAVKKKKRAEPDDEPRPAAPKKKKKPPVEEPIDDGTGAIKLEATPALDTYEARQRVRWAIGGILVVIGLIGLIVVLKAFKGSTPEEVREAESSDGRPSVSQASAEREARILLDMAKQADRNGKTATAVDQLRKLTKNYNGTAAAREGLIALDRHKLDKSLFGQDEPTELSGPKPPPPGSGTAPGPVVVKPSPTANPNPGGVNSPPGAPPVVVVTPPPPPPVTKPLPVGYRPNFDLPIHPSGWPTRIICDRDGAELVLVMGTTFRMGRNGGLPEEGPAHEVFVSTYYIDQHEVTVGQYLRFLKETGRSVAKIAGKGEKILDDMPAVNVSWGEAKDYTDWAKRRLPTEAQWELAARGPEGRISYWGEVLPRADPEKGDRTMEIVMSLKSDRSPYDAYDLGANAWEWTSEWFDTKYYKQFTNLVRDPTGPKERLARLAEATVKGGSKQGVLTWRDGLRIEFRRPYVGFRGALPVEGAPVEPPKPPGQDAGPPRGGGVQPF